MIQELLTEQRTHQLFSEHALLFGVDDAVPISVAIDLFGEEAVNRIFRHQRDDLFDSWGIRGGERVEDDFSVDILTKRGFLYAATYRNVILMREQSRVQHVEKENAV